MMWRPIDQLPESWKDGREFMVFNGRSSFVVFFDTLLERWFQPSQIDDRPFKMNNVTHFAPRLTPENDPVGKLVEALERAECELIGWIVAHDRHEDRVAVKGIQAALAAYREAMGEKA